MACTPLLFPHIYTMYKMIRIELYKHQEQARISAILSPLLYSTVLSLSAFKRSWFYGILPFRKYLIKGKNDKIGTSFLKQGNFPRFSKRRRECSFFNSIFQQRVARGPLPNYTLYQRCHSTLHFRRSPAARFPPCILLSLIYRLHSSLL